MITRWLLLMTLLCAAPLTTAQVYQWVDENGNRHFSDTPPADNSKAKDISDNLKSGNIDESRAERQKLKKLFTEPTQEESYYKKQQQAADKEKQKKKQEYCAYLKDRLRKISRRVMFVDDQGNDVRVSEAERKQRVKDLQKMIKQRC